MRIVVNDIAASYGGALTILKQLYSYIREHDKENEWIFVLSEPHLEETENIKVVINRDVKKSGLHKLYFDFISGRRCIEALHPDVVLSMQNIITFGIKEPQYTYIHQSIPYQDAKKFSFLKKQERSTAFYQYVIGGLINMSCRRAEGVFVQTEWMRKAVARKAGISEQRIQIVFPDVQSAGKACARCYDIKNQFFYPTNSEIYKNIGTILKACDILNKRGIEDFQVILTVPQGQIQNKNIVCAGYLSKEEMAGMYAESTLIFPSYIETVGLPLLEAADAGCYILAANCPYAVEVLEEYQRVRYFEPFNANELADLMQQGIKGKLGLPDVIPQNYSAQHKKPGWGVLYETISLRKK